MSLPLSARQMLEHEEPIAKITRYDVMIPLARHTHSDMSHHMRWLRATAIIYHAVWGNGGLRNARQAYRIQMLSSTRLVGVARVPTRAPATVENKSERDCVCVYVCLAIWVAGHRGPRAAWREREAAGLGDYYSRAP